MSAVGEEINIQIEVPNDIYLKRVKQNDDDDDDDCQMELDLDPNDVLDTSANVQLLTSVVPSSTCGMVDTIGTIDSRSDGEISSSSGSESSDMGMLLIYNAN
jgi:hypothetical protein